MKRKYKRRIVQKVSLSPANISQQKKLNPRTIRNEIPITEEDRITYIYKVDPKNIVCEITCVSYEILINAAWITIIYYDSSHDGLLHRHARASYNNQDDAPTIDGVRNRGTQHRLLTWSVKDLQSNFVYYKKEFRKRCKKEKSIDF